VRVDARCESSIQRKIWTDMTYVRPGGVHLQNYRIIVHTDDYNIYTYLLDW